MRRDEILHRLRSCRSKLEELGAGSLHLFGSAARDEAKPDSDVDLLVHFSTAPTYSGYMQLKLFLEELLDAKVDLVTEAGLRDRVRPYVEGEAILVA